MTKVNKILNKLTFQERKFVLELLKHGNQTKSARVAFNIGSKSKEPTPERLVQSATTMGNIVANRPRVKKAMEELMEEINLTDEDIAQKLSQHLHKGKAEISMKAIDTACKIKGLYKEEKHRHIFEKLPFMEEIETTEETGKIKWEEKKD